MRHVLRLGDPVLRQKAQKVRHIDKSMDRLINEMVEAMHAENGIGLAANQIGVPLRVIVVQLVDDGAEPESGKLYALINPEIVKYSDELVTAEEGCLSVPHYYGEVTRPAEVVVRARDRKGHETKVKAAGLLARAFQHEIDHLDGILFIDRMESLDKLRYIPRRPTDEQGAEKVAADQAEPICA